MQEIFLKDYQKPDFNITHTELEFEVGEKKTTVQSHLHIQRVGDSETLTLNGQDLELISVMLDREVCDYQVIEGGIQIPTHKKEFVVSIQNAIHPLDNHSCEGLYKSGDILCTQNEPEGFRHITYFIDRPDIMSSFKTTLTGSKKDFPYLLSNGNLISKTEQGENHTWVWDDPFPKPCYLFALVAGDLELVTDTFTTKSGRKVELEIYVDSGNEDKTKQAMDSLINAMKWDEQRFRLEYDLDKYMIVAVDSFNMGAMENKGLNIFNSHYVLATPETATDQDFKNIEAVIGHEYFHNWTGNRVTCRDWFQLTLKEGLTVFRDQEFSADLGSRTVLRIHNVDLLKNHQFPEDAGPLSHPIKPKSYAEINNFYTATVYEKGAEVIRMIHTLIGEENFQKGMDLYFARHDGQAVTTEDFVQAMEDASGHKLDHFKVWYDQNGTPKITVTTEYDDSTSKLTLNFQQLVQTNNEKFDCLYMPFHLSLLAEDGKELLTEKQQNFILNKKEQSLVLENIPKNSLALFNCNFSSPVDVDYDYSIDEKLVIINHSLDYYSVYHMMQGILMDEIQRGVELIADNSEYTVSDKTFMAFDSIMNHPAMDNELRAITLSLPTERYVYEKSVAYNAELVKKAYSILQTSLANNFKEQMYSWCEDNELQKTYSLEQKYVAQRSLRGLYLNYLCSLGEEKYLQFAKNIFEKSNNMTDELNSFKALIQLDHKDRNEVIETFYKKWKANTLVFQKWLGALTSSALTTLDDIKKWEILPEFDQKVPNHLRALYGGFVSNLNVMASGDEKLYKFIADTLGKIDSYNPQLAAGLAKKLSIIKKIPKENSAVLKIQLTELMKNKKLSNDLDEVITKTLK